MGKSDTVADSLRGLATEGVDTRFAGIDKMSALELAGVMNEADAEVPRAVAGALPVIATVIEAVVDRMAKGGRLRYVGAGTAGRMAVVRMPAHLFDASRAGSGDLGRWPGRHDQRRRRSRRRR